MSSSIWPIKSQPLINHLVQLNYLSANPTQKLLFDHWNTNKASISVANTGKGKTLGLIIYLLDQLMTQSANQAIVILPTKELIQQVYLIAQQLNINNQLVIKTSTKTADVTKLIQADLLLVSVDKLVGLSQSMRQLTKTRTCILALDEADVLMSDEFFLAIKPFYLQTQSWYQQKIAVCATFKKHSLSLLKKMLGMKAAVLIDEVAHQYQPKHYYLLTRPDKRIDDLVVVLNQAQKKAGTIIFVNTKKSLLALAAALQVRCSFKILLFHGEMQAKQRQQMFQQIKQNEQVVVLATDILARGISIKQIQTVINYELPPDHLWYVHRSGRTGRFEQPGEVISLITETEVQYFTKLASANLVVRELKIRQGQLSYPKQQRNYVKRLDQAVNLQIQQIYAQADLRVKPNYKKKLKAQVSKVHQAAKRAKIEKAVKTQLLAKWKKATKNRARG